MKTLPKVSVLYYSKILAVPILSEFLYYMQNILFEKNLINIFFLARKKTNTQIRLINKLSKKEKLILKSYKMAHLLKHFDTEIIADLQIDNFKKLSKNDAYMLLWTLIMASKVTPQTKKNLKGFIPEDFPIYIDKI